MLSDSLDSERAVSPVIGVILMVAITVTLAAVVGAFVMGIGGSLVQPAPQANLEMADADMKAQFEGDFSAQAGEKILQIEHRGGDELPAKELKIIIEQKGGDKKFVDSDLADDRFDSSALTYNSTISSKDSITVGKTLIVEEIDTHDVDIPNGQYEVTVIHKRSNSIVDSQTITIE